MQHVKEQRRKEVDCVASTHAREGPACTKFETKTQGDVFADERDQMITQAHKHRHKGTQHKRAHTHTLTYIHTHTHIYIYIYI